MSDSPSPRLKSLASDFVMDASGETFTDQEITEVPKTTESHHKREHEDELGLGGGGDKRWPGWPGESVFRLLVPAHKVGGIIGRKGEFIKKMCEESKARIKILDSVPGAPERAVIVSAKEELDASISPAMDGLLKVHRRVIDGLDSGLGHAPPNAGGMSTTRLLVAATQAGSLIGKQGSTIKSIQEESHCTIRVLEDLPSCALVDDRVVEIQGEPPGLHKAVELIASQLRKFLVDKSILPLFENIGGPNLHREQGMPHQPWGPHQGGSYPGPGGSMYGNSPHFMPPPWKSDNRYPPSDIPGVDKPPHQGFSAYGRDPPIGVHQLPSSQPPPSVISQISQQMQIPLSYADAVIGSGGSSISYIRRASGASITIQESRGVPGEMTVEINGSASRVQTAQQLIQNFMAEAGGPMLNQLNHVDPSYNSYPPQKSMYSSPRSNPGPAGGYGGNYGY